MSLESLSLDTTALLAVDMQNAFCHPEGTLGISGVDVGPAQATIEPVRRLVEAARAARVPGLWTPQGHFAAHPSRAPQPPPSPTPQPEPGPPPPGRLGLG